MVPRLRVRLALLTAACVTVAAPLGAQQAAALRSGAAPPLVARAPLESSGLVPPSQYPSAWRYVGTGALIGGAVAAVAVGVAYVQLQDTECMGCVLMIPVVVGGGAALGAATGYLVHRVRYD